MILDKRRRTGLPLLSLNAVWRSSSGVYEVINLWKDGQ